MSQFFLGSSQDAINELSIRTTVVSRALALLCRIHHEILMNESHRHESAEVKTSIPVGSTRAYDSRTVRIANALLDLISLEGIYPFLSSGVGIPLERRVNFLLRAGFTSRRLETSQLHSASGEDLSLLKEVVHRLNDIICNGRGIKSLVEERVLPDIIAACAELVYGPNIGDQSAREKHDVILHDLIGAYVTSERVPLLF